MVESFNPQEILKVAIAVEKNGKELYEALEAKTKSKELTEVWKYLKEQEIEHAKIFQDILDNSGDYLIYEYGIFGEHDAYLRALASSYIFTQELIEKKKKELFDSDLDAISFGIDIEKESIIVYLSLKDYLISDKQSILDKIIGEEKKHLVRLIDLRNRFVSE